MLHENSVNTAESFIEIALEEIRRSYNHYCRVGRKSLHKYGYGDSLDQTETEINALNQNEIYPTSNTIDTVSSSSTDDVGSMAVEGMYYSGSPQIFSFSSQTVSLNGRNKVTLSQPLARCTRLASDFDNAGDIYVYPDAAITNGVPNSLAEVSNYIPVGEGSSLKAGTTVAHNNYFIVTNIYAYLNKKSSATADIRFRIRKHDKSFVTKYRATISDSVNLDHSFLPYYIIEPGSDIYMTAACSTSNVEISAGFGGFFADIIT